MTDQNLKDDEPTVQLPRLPVQAQEFDPDKTLVVEDWSQLTTTTAPAHKPR